jgi:CHAT domain-containing protein
MLYKKTFFLLLFVGLIFSAYAQADLVSLLEKEDYTAVKEYLGKLTESALLPVDIVAINHAFIAANDAKRERMLHGIENEWLIGTFSFASIGSNELLSVEIPLEESMQSLEWIRAKFKRMEDWNSWGAVTRILLINCYSYREKYSDIKRYIDDLMSKWEYYDASYKVQFGLLAGNHFMGVAQDFDKAAKCYKQILALDSLGENSQTQIFINLAELYLRKKDLDRALEYSTKVLHRSGKIASTILIAELTRVGEIYELKGDLNKSEKFYLEAEKYLPPDINTIRGDEYILLSYVYLYTSLLDIQLRKENYKKAAVYAEMLENSIESIYFLGQSYYLTLEYLLMFYNKTDNHLKFMAIDKDLLNDPSLNYPFAAKLQTTRGDYYFKNKNFSQAMSLYNVALDVLKDVKSKKLSFSYTQDAPQALIILIKKLNTLYVIKNRGISSSDLKNEIYSTAQQAVLLLDQVQQSLSTKDAKLKILNSGPQIYEHALEIVWEKYQESNDKNYLKEMYSLIEKSKAMLLSEALNEDEAKKFGGVPLRLREKEKGLVNDLKFYNSKLYQAETSGDAAKVNLYQNIIFEKRNTLDDLKIRLEKDYRKYYELKFQNKMEDIGIVQKELKKQNATFVSYFVGKRNLYIFNITGTSYNARVEAFPNNLTPNFSSNVLTFRSNLSDIVGALRMKPEGFKKFTTLSNRFYKLLLAKELEDNKSKRLIISPDALLHYIPFEALLGEEVEEGEGINFQILPYLIKDFQISYNYTATLWLKSLEANKGFQPTSGGILGMAATYTTPESKMNKAWLDIRKNLEELDGAKAEVEFLSETYNGSYWIGEGATEAKFKEEAPSYNIIHLAMHGLVDNRMPMNSGLVFTENGDTTTENVLLAYELSSLNLNTSLLVLSACSTAYGQYKKGEGVMSLGRGFMYAGASSILTTLWSINDQSSQRIMQYFYENLYAGMDKDEALRQAKIDYLEEAQGVIAHPAFWAAYVLMGDTGTISISKPTNWWLWGSVALGLGVLRVVVRARASFFSIK